MKQRFNELICVLTSHRWERRRTHEIDCEVGFQPNAVMLAEVGVMDVYTSYDYCDRCGLLRDCVTHAGFVSVGAS